MSSKGGSYLHQTILTKVKLMTKYFMLLIRRITNSTPQTLTPHTIKSRRTLQPKRRNRPNNDIKHHKRNRNRSPRHIPSIRSFCPPKIGEEGNGRKDGRQCSNTQRQIRRPDFSILRPQTDSIRHSLSSLVKHH